MDIDLQSELNSIREEYSNLKTHLTDIELKYQKALINKDDKESEDDKSFNECLRATVAGLFNNKLYSDVVILLENKEKVYGHKLVLSSRIPQWVELDSQESVDLTEVNYSVGIAIIRWIYTNQIDIIQDEKFLIDFLQACYRFHLTPLINRCEKVVLFYLDKVNCQLFYDLSIKLGNKKIENHCLQLIRDVGTNNDDDKDEVIIAIAPLDCENQPETEIEKQPETEIENQPETVMEKQPVTKIQNQPETVIKYQADFTRPKRGRRKVTEDNSQNKCTICNRIFKSARILTAHNQAHEKQLANFPEQKHHDPNKPFKFLRKKKTLNTTCDICHKKFATPSSLDRHKLNHTDQGPVTCPHCDREYKSLDTLSHHIRYKHSGKIREKKHTCEECGNSYISESLLKKHQVKHTGKRPYKCSLCEKTFLEKGQKVRHEKLHTGVRAFVCESCGFAFSEKGNLEKHIASVHRLEKHFACDVCQKKFFRMDTLKKHQLMHTGEKPHMCLTCGRYFAMKSNMIKHQMVHTGAKPYKCSVCDKGFTERGHVKRHMKVHDKVNVKGEKEANGIEQVVLVVVKSEDTQDNIVVDKNQTFNESSQSLGQGQMVEHEGQLLNVEGHIIVHVDNHGNLVDNEGNFIASHGVVLDENQINDEDETIVGQTDPFGNPEQIANIKNEFIKF